MKLLVKNMVSLRCKLIVKSTLEKMGLHFTVVELGEVEITEELSSDRLNELKVTLLSFGLELMEQVLISLKEESPIKNVPVVIYSTSLPSLLKQALVNLGAHSGMIKSRNYEEFNAQVLEFKTIALSQQAPVHTGATRDTSKFFRKVTSFTKTNQSEALKRAVDENVSDTAPIIQTNSFQNLNRIKNLN